jgi:hypothetical protein
MATRRILALLLFSIFASMGAQFRTPNFTVEAPTPEIAKKIGQYAEYYRKEKAMQWLGREMPQWPEPCPIKVTVTLDGAGGATSFAFDRGQVLGQNMQIEGSYERLVNSVLPHEVTHTVFAYYFRCPVPRWADEGGSVLSEDDVERGRHDRMVRDKLNAGRAIPLRRLLPLKDYPNDMESVMSLYAEGFSVTDFLVNQSSRPEFLKFVGDGMRYGWDEATKTHYQFENTNALEEAWLAHLRKTKKQRNGTLASNGEPTDAETTGRIVERRTSPPAQPLGDDQRPTFRGQNPAELEPPDDRYRDRSARPGYLPDPIPLSSKRTDSSGVRLGAPDSGPVPTTFLGQPCPATATPGYPR